MSDSWKEWEGQTIDGKFPLLRYAGESEHSVVFLTERPADGNSVPAAIKMIPAGADQGERQLKAWREAGKLSHPHLIRLYEMGRCEIGGIDALYVVMERADENLAQIVPGRALVADEARAVLDSAADVLAFLHAKGFVHGRIKPSNILAADDQLKLSSDGLCRAGDPADRRSAANAYDPPEYKASVIAMPQTMAPSGDVWSLGMMLVEALTQALPAARTDEQQNPEVPQNLPNPFLDVANHCLVRHPQGRWTAVQIKDCLQGRMPKVEAQIAQPAIRERAAPMASPPPARPEPVQPQVRRAAEPPRKPAKRRSFAVPVALGLAALAAAVVFGVKFFRNGAQPGPAPATASEQLAPAAAATSAPAPAPSAKLDTAQPPKSEPASSVPALSDDEPSSRAPVPTPASIHPAAAPEAESSPVANLSTANPARGEVAHRAMPEVLSSARNSIRGTVRVIVKVNVDRDGNVEDAELAARGPSKYFAREALDAARLWKFKPPRIGGQGVLSSWRLQFEFTRDGTNVIPSQEMP